LEDQITIGTVAPTPRGTGEPGAKLEGGFAGCILAVGSRRLGDSQLQALLSAWSRQALEVLEDQITIGIGGPNTMNYRRARREAVYQLTKAA
jgi:hypothetical protein